MLFRVSAGTGWLGGNILDEIESMICTSYLSLVARALASADPRMRYASWDVKQPVSNNIAVKFERADFIFRFGDSFFIYHDHSIAEGKPRTLRARKRPKAELQHSSHDRNEI